MVIELCVVQFWSEIIFVISNQTRAARSFDFEITRMISDQIALHSVQLPLLIWFCFTKSRDFLNQLEVQSRNRRPPNALALIPFQGSLKGFVFVTVVVIVVAIVVFVVKCCC